MTELLHNYILYSYSYIYDYDFYYYHILYHLHLHSFCHTWHMHVRMWCACQYNICKRYKGEGKKLASTNNNRMRHKSYAWSNAIHISGEANTFPATLWHCCLCNFVDVLDFSYVNTKRNRFFALNTQNGMMVHTIHTPHMYKKIRRERVRMLGMEKQAKENGDKSSCFFIVLPIPKNRKKWKFISYTHRVV